MNALQKELTTMQKRNDELSMLFKHLYEDNVLGKATNEQYRVLSNEYLAEQNAIREELPKAQERQRVLRDSVSNGARFIDKAKKYETIDELTPEILRTFIKRIEVGEREKKYSRNASQDITIYYRDVGAMDELPQQRKEKARKNRRKSPEHGTGTCALTQVPVRETRFN